MKKTQGAIFDRRVGAAPNVSVTVYNQGTSNKPTIYSDNGVTPQANPFQTDSLGRWAFYVANGRYDIEFSGATVSTYKLEDIVIEEGLDSYAALAGHPGGQTLHGGTGPSENLILQSTLNATKGKIYLGVNDYYDEAAQQLRVSDIVVGSPWFDVRKYSNDIAAALSAIGTAGGGKLVLPKATYLKTTTTSFKIPSNCHILCLPGAIVKLGDGVGPVGGMNIFENIDKVNGNLGITLENMEINGNKANNPTSKTNAVALYGVQRFAIINPHLYNNPSADFIGFGDGIYITISSNNTQSRYGTIVGGWLHDNGRNGLSILSLQYSSIDGVKAYANGWAGLDFEPDASAMAVGEIGLSNIIANLNAKYGIVMFDNSGGSSVSGFTLNNINANWNQFNGIYIKTWSYLEMANIKARHNSQIESNVHSGIYIENSFYTKIRNAELGGTNHKYCLEMNGTSDYLFLDGVIASGYVTKPFLLTNKHNRLRDCFTNETTSISSGTTITLPDHGDHFLITGTTQIETITNSWIGRRVTLEFGSNITIKNGSNLKLAGDFAATANDILQLVSCNDGTFWNEVSRSPN